MTEPTATRRVAAAPIEQRAGADEGAQRADEAQVSNVLEVVYRHPRHRELYYKALCLSEREWAVEDLEDALEAQPEYAGALQTSTTLVNVLIEAGGLAYAEYDAAGEPITQERIEALVRAGASDDDLFDLVSRRTVVSTSAGLAVAGLLNPEVRVRSYATSVPERTPVYRELLAFCATPRTLQAINELFAGNEVLVAPEKEGAPRIHPSYFIDRMDEAGGLVWRHGWVTTAAGKAFLAADDDR